MANHTRSMTTPTLSSCISNIESSCKVSVMLQAPRKARQEHKEEPNKRLVIKK